MKQLLFNYILLFLFFSLHTVLAQDEPDKMVDLNQRDSNIADPRLLMVSQSQSIQFKATDGDFAIIIRRAGDFLEGVTGDLHIRINSAADSLSEIYTVKRGIPDQIISYEIFSISSQKFPEAPPKIILVHE